jgi:hypothetical protein
MSDVRDDTVLLLESLDLGHRTHHDTLTAGRDGRVVT